MKWSFKNRHMLAIALVSLLASVGAVLLLPESAPDPEWELVYPGEGFASSPFQRRWQDPPDALRVEGAGGEAAGPALLGRCLDHEGHPVSDLTIEVLVGPGAAGQDVSVRRAATGQLGRFRVDMQGAPGGRVEVAVRSEEHADLLLQLRFSPREGPRDLGDLILSRGCLVNGQLQDSQGAPLPNRSIWWEVEQGRGTARSSFARGKIAADANGRFSLGRVLGGLLTLNVGTERGDTLSATWSTTIFASQRERELVVVVSGAESLEVQVEDAAGQPFPDEVEFRVGAYPAGLREKELEGHRIKDGLWRVRLPDLQWEVEATSLGFRPCYVRRLPKTDLARGRARLVRGGDSVRVTAARMKADDMWLVGITSRTHPGQFPALRSLQVDTDGCIRVTAAEGCVMPGQSIVLADESLEFYGTSEPIRASDLRSDAAPLLVSLAPLQRLPVRCVDGTTGTPVSDVVVSASQSAHMWAAHPSAWGQETQFTGGVRSGHWEAYAQSVTNGDGTCALPVPESGRIRLWASHPDYAFAVVANVSGSSEEVAVKLRRGARISVELQDPGDTREVAVLDVQSGGRILSPSQSNVRRCEFSGLGPGAYLVGPRRDLQLALRFAPDLHSAVARSIDTVERVVLAPGQETTIVLPSFGMPGFLEGSIPAVERGVIWLKVRPEDCPVPPSGRYDRVAKDGTCRLGPLSPGRYIVDLFTGSSRGRPVSSRRVTVAAGAGAIDAADEWAHCIVHVTTTLQWGTLRVVDREDRGQLYLPVRNGKVVFDLSPGEYRLVLEDSPASDPDRVTEISSKWVTLQAGENVFRVP